MLVVVDSLTGQGQRFAEKLGVDFTDINLGLEDDQSPLFLITRSFNFGEIPEPTLDFLERYSQRVVGVAVSGNRNWGTNFGAAGDKIAAKYAIPLVTKFEGSGFKHDVDHVKTWIETYERSHAQ